MAPAFSLPDYDVFLGPVAEALPAWLRQQPAYSRIFLLADANAHACGAHRLPPLDAETHLVPVPPLTEGVGGAERLKTLDTCALIWSAMLDARLDRKALVVNFGGGVIGDMGGFCAAAYKRGVDFVQIPTTLLAMTDAAIGGKLGIDFQGVKNAVGFFQNPKAVFVDPVFLQTLPARERLSGFAEVIKHARIGDPALLEKIQALPAESLAPNGLSTAEWTDILRASIAVKVRIVTEDPHERGIRALLNFGHTFGHALESYFLQTDDPMTHGEAVTVGMVCETPPPTPPPEGRGAYPHISFTSRNKMPVVNRNQAPLPSGGGVGGGAFPHRPIPESAFPALWELMLQDKKNTSGAVRIAVPDAEPFSMRWEEITREEAEWRLRGYNALLHRNKSNKNP